MKACRLIGALYRRGSLREFFMAFPVLVPVYLYAAIGESLGFLIGEGRSMRIFSELELGRLRMGSAK